MKYGDVLLVPSVCSRGCYSPSQEFRGGSLDQRDERLVNCWIRRVTVGWNRLLDSLPRFDRFPTAAKAERVWFYRANWNYFYRGFVLSRVFKRKINLLRVGFSANATFHLSSFSISVICWILFLNTVATKGNLRDSFYVYFYRRDNFAKFDTMLACIEFTNRPIYLIVGLQSIMHFHRLHATYCE